MDLYTEPGQSEVYFDQVKIEDEDMSFSSFREVTEFINDLDGKKIDITYDAPYGRFGSFPEVEKELFGKMRAAAPNVIITGSMVGLSDV